MIDSVVPNPKKEVRVNAPAAKVKEVINSLPDFVKPTKINIANDLMGFYQFEAPTSGLFSLGMLLELCVHEVSDNQTLIQFEGRRKVGWINSTHEIGETNNFILGCISLIGKGLKGELK